MRVLFRPSCLALSAVVLLGATLVLAEPKAPAEKQSVPTLTASHKIDQLVEAGYQKHDLQPNPISSGGTFVRRVYLDVIGRIPTYDEAVEFLVSRDPAKRSKLIDKLLDSEGYVSHNFNYWADLLRIQNPRIFQQTQPYVDFVKSSLGENKPYDAFVRELIMADGYAWDNGAVGYYQRDPGMPLDNMSNTVRVFLGTQLLCAQCHNHPFDTWTQRQYYQLAAFTYGVTTYDVGYPMLKQLRQMKSDKSANQSAVNTAFGVLSPLRNRVHESERRVLRLPHDYQYGDGKPGDRVDPKTIFGEDVAIRPGDSRRKIYANWMTSPKNPRFSRVIANRLWKRLMGIGVIEPVDDLNDKVEPSNPELMDFLTDTMVRSNFDLKQYFRILLNTKTYQRDVSLKEVVVGEPYHFPGPVLRRMTAEQVWDSLLTIVVPELDERRFTVQRDRQTRDGSQVVDKSLEEILEIAAEESRASKLRSQYFSAIAKLRPGYLAALKAGDQDKVRASREKFAEIRKQIYGAESYEKLIREEEALVEQMRSQRIETDPRWLGLAKDLVRASELPSPSPPGHFLRQFGQSDREVIGNSNSDASVPQILTLLNGPLLARMTNQNSLLQKQLAKTDTPLGKLEVLYISMLGRRPTQRERKIILPRLKRDGDQAVATVVRALLNTRQFIFVQ